MQRIHVRNLEKYQDGYKDRRHHWSKIYIDMIQGNPEAEMLCEIDFARLVKFIVLESCGRNEIPVSEIYLQRKGFDFGLRSLETTLQELSHFIEIKDVTESKESVTVSLRREEKSREEKICAIFENFWKSYPKKRSKGQAEKAWAKIKPDEQLNKRILSALERAKTSAEWRKDGGQFIPYPATWLNAKGWEDVQEVISSALGRDKKPDSKCPACGGTGQLEKSKCWCWS